MYELFQHKSCGIIICKRGKGGIKFTDKGVKTEKSEKEREKTEREQLWATKHTNQ